VPTTYAAWPVWSDSTTKEIKFQPMPKKAAARLYHKARAFARQLHQHGEHGGGGLTHATLKVLEALIFDFLNYASGRLDPSQAAIAKAAGVCERTVRNAIKTLRKLGILNWVRRCCPVKQDDGTFALEQDTNAYAVLPSSQWSGFKEPPEAPPPAPGTWGDHPPLPDVITQALADRRDGAGLDAALTVMEQDPTDGIAAVCARLFRAVQAREAAKTQ
jgi:hypothetical protein